MYELTSVVTPSGIVLLIERKDENWLFFLFLVTLSSQLTNHLKPFENRLFLLLLVKFCN